MAAFRRAQDGRVKLLVEGAYTVPDRRNAATTNRPRPPHVPDVHHQMMHCGIVGAAEEPNRGGVRQTG